MLKRSTPATGIESRGWELPSFIFHVDGADRKAYRLAIERWEAEGGATLEPDDPVTARARDMQHVASKVSM